MKKMRKLLTWLLTLAVTLTAAAALAPLQAQAAGNGKITIANATEGQEYHLWRIFDLTSHSDDNYVYHVNADWQNFVGQDSISGAAGYVSVDGNNGQVTWKSDKATPDDVKDFAGLALAYAENTGNPVDPVKTVSSKTTGENDVTVTPNADGTYTIVISGLDLGYYLMDSSVGTLCTLNTTANEVTISDKNAHPDVDKEVDASDGGTTEDWQKENTAQVGDTVKFKVTVTAQAGAENYVLHEVMDDGLTFDVNNANIAVTLNGAAVAESAYSVQTSPGAPFADHNCTFEMYFTKDFCDALKAGDQIVITYSATLNENAVADLDAEKNTVHLSYGENNDLTTTEKVTETETFQFQIIKTDSDGEDGSGEYNVITGAKFELYDAQTGGNKIPLKAVMKTGSSTEVDYYRVATPDEITVAGFVSAVIEAGTPVIKGLDDKVYWLEETKAPDGYNTIDGRIRVDLTNGSNVAGDGALTNGNTIIYKTSPAGVGGGVQVINRSGNRLPSTGGIGTTVFYVIGAVLVIGAGLALLLLNRRGRKASEK